MSLFWKRENAVRAHIREYFHTVDAAIEEFEVAMACYLEKGRCQELYESDQRLHANESRADDVRIEVEKTLYRRVLLPESRGDILGLLETFDRIPNIAETVTGMIWNQRIMIPAIYKERFRTMLKLNIEAYRLVRRGVDMLFSDPDAVEAAVAPVDSKESASDKIEKELIGEIFGSDIDKADMILYRQLVSMVSDISDAAERVAHRLEIIALKRRI